MVTVGVVGAGNISPTHGNGWRQLGVDLVVHSLEGADAFAERWGARKVDTLDELLASCDIVDVITPTPVHAEIIEAALRAGKDVVSEKPLARTVPDAERLVALASDLGRTIHPAHVVRWFPQHAAAKLAIDEGRLGELAILRFTRSGTYPSRGWFADPVQSGGIAMDLMIHDLDQAVWMAGDPLTVHAVSHAATEPHPVETCLVTMTHPGGVVSHCRGLWGPPATEFRYTFHLSGTGGTLTYDSLQQTGFSISAPPLPDDGTYLPTVASFADPYAAEIADFYAALTGSGEPPRVTLHDGLTAVRVAEAANESLRTRQPVVLSDGQAAGGEN